MVAVFSWQEAYPLSVPDLSEIAPRLTEVEPGRWAAEETEVVSYPADRHRVLVGLEEDSFWFAHRADVVTAVLARYPAPGCIFDVGGGTGYMVQAIRKTGAEAILVEPGEDGVRAAHERGLRPVVNATPATAGFLPGTMAAVSMFDVLEHIEDHVGFLRHVHDLLMPQGRL